MLTSVTDKPAYTESMQSLKQTCYLTRKKTSLVNKGKNMLHKLILMQIAWPYPIGKNRNRCIQILLFSFGE